MFLFIVTYIGLFFYVYNICLYITILWFDDTASVYNIFLFPVLFPRARPCVHMRKHINNNWVEMALLASGFEGDQCLFCPNSGVFF